MHTPERATGGCLCGGVRYRIDFAPDHDWKRAPNTCQCTQCRKMCGSLVFNFHTVQNTEITWLTKSTYAEYNSSAHFLRAFCKKCGSSIAWINSGKGSEMELAAGTFDEEFLVGDRDGEDRPLGGYGIALANPMGDHLHLRNEIKDVTDGSSVKGTRFWKGPKEGAMEKNKST
ncbi:Mss4-like protein [Mycena vitilis]|nr:Mss4-like protein [Mycena vitilis]